MLLLKPDVPAMGVSAYGTLPAGELQFRAYPRWLHLSANERAHLRQSSLSEEIPSFGHGSERVMQQIDVAWIEANPEAVRKMIKRMVVERDEARAITRAVVRAIVALEEEAEK